MPSSRPPSLRLHASGQYMVTWGGRDHYLGRNLASARTAYAAQLTEWAAWRATRSSARPQRGTRTLVELAAEWYGVLLTDAGPAAEAYYRRHTTRFIAAWGEVPARAIQPPAVHPAAWLQALKADMARIGYAPRTINHDLLAAKRLLTWAGDMGYIPALSLRAARPMRLGERRRIDVPLAQVQTYIAEASAADPRLRPWLSLHYLAALRPRELLDLIHRRGEWEFGGPITLGVDASRGGSPGLQGSVYRVTNKVSKATHEHRYLILSPRALAQLALCEPHWQTGWGYYQALVKARAGKLGGAHFLRHSAASHLRSVGVAVAEIQIALGHWPPGAWQSYVRESWHTPLKIMNQLTL